MSAANEVRGEFEITLEGVAYGMRPSYEAIVAFEKGTGQSLIELARASNGGALSVSDAATIVTECVRAWGRHAKSDAAHFNVERVGSLLIDTGFTIVQERLRLMLFVAATGGVTGEGEAKRRSMNTPVPTPADASPASQPPPSAGAHKSGGKAPRPSSGRRGRSGEK